MRYIYIGLILLAISGCNSSSNNNTTVDTPIPNPIAPSTQDVDNKPPSIPNL